MTSVPPIPIFHLITELSTGGAQVALLRLLERLDRSRFEPKVACLYNGHAQVAQQIRALGVPVTDLRMLARWRVDALARLYHLLRAEQPAILHTWLFHANFPGRVLGRLAGVPSIVSSERTMGMESRARGSLNRLTAPLADRIICVSERVAAFASQEVGLPASKLVVISNGVDLAAFTHLPTQAEARLVLGLPQEARIVGSIGRLQPVKGFQYLLEAFAQLPADDPLTHAPTLLVIAGDGPELANLTNQARQLELEGRVIFLGHRSDVPLVLAAFDLFALSSLHEGMPNAVIEAMAAGLPVAATAAGGTPEVVVDGQTGLLVPPADPAALASALARLLQDPSLRIQMGQAGQQRARSHFDMAEVTRKTERLYEELLAQKATHS